MKGNIMERNKMKKKGFTLVELLVVIAIIAMLLAILMPALGKVRQLAQRMVCGTNLGGIGKAMLTYTNDDKYESYPIAGPSGTKINNAGTAGTAPVEEDELCTWDWWLKAIPGSTDNPGTANDQTTSVGACLYLLVKYADVSPDQFTCPGGEEKKFELSKYTLTATNTTLTDVWDFGSKGKEITENSRGRGHVSYSYQLPLPVQQVTSITVAFPITTTSNPAKAVMADRNPFFDSARIADAAPYTWIEPDGSTPGHIDMDATKVQVGNATAHQKEGQNVLYVDSHTKFEKTANCGIEQDNIYTTWGTAPSAWAGYTTIVQDPLRQRGGPAAASEPVPSGTDNINAPQDDSDGFLVNDWN
jgi:prepilin-type N-terminal cleavage/methylation domain-containing protein